MSDPEFIAAGTVIMVGALIGYSILLCRQFLETRRLRQRGITLQRWAVFAVLLFLVVAIVPVLTYRVLRVLGVESVLLANISTILSPLALFLALVPLFILSFGKVDLGGDK